MKRQLAYILARAQVPYHWLQHSATDDEGDETLEDLPEDLQEILFNSRLSTHFKQFGKELGVQDPKSLEDVYKSHLETSRTSDFVSFGRPHIYVMRKGSSTASVDSARGNLAGTFVNAFVNAGFGNDKLMVDAEEGNSWIYKNKDHGEKRGPILILCGRPYTFPTGMLSAAASLGLSLLWDTDIGLSHIDKYPYSSEEYIKVRICIRLDHRSFLTTRSHRPVLFLPPVSLTPAFVLMPTLR
jgi:26S proteasome regulatory subunit N1